ncbi:hypothetical protein [uncultured Mucilaginibacter sp.]|uniref:hypothetical protein n=1 Tax=uncultured Mucilaginibacter sp. TaxID=797541 RepID=UPI0025E0C3EB|nr:hypothetical protein [uncultured Mucilaginibacter sp.]
MGVDFLSVVILLVIAAIPVFFFWRLVFRKNQSKARKRIITVLLTVVTIPILYFLLIFGWVETVQYYPNRDFDENAWKADSDRRYEYTHDLIKRKLLIGKTRAQVEYVLGKNSDTSQTEFYYYIGFRPEITGIDPSTLIINLRNGKVDTVIEYDK